MAAWPDTTQAGGASSDNCSSLDLEVRPSRSRTCITPGLFEAGAKAHVAIMRQIPPLCCLDSHYLLEYRKKKEKEKRKKEKEE